MLAERRKAVGIFIAIVAVAALAAAALMLKKTPAAPPVPASAGKSAEVLSVLGTVAQVSGASLTLTNVRDLPPPDQGGDGLRTAPVTVLIDTSTVIEKLVQKSDATIRREAAAYAARVAQSTPEQAALLVPPESVTRAQISLGDLKVGELALVIAAQDIAASTSFTAARVELPPSSASAPPPTIAHPKTVSPATTTPLH